MTDSIFKLSTLNTQEINQFDQVANRWWDEKGPFRTLHEINRCRLGFIKDHIVKKFHLNPLEKQPLKGLKILDVGCGGGILCEPLARLGATVTGIDGSSKAIEVAKHHAQLMGLDISYSLTTVENFREKDFDVVCAIEIIEHVNQPLTFVGSCAELLSKNGLFFVSTLNKTWKSYVQGIIAAEYILRWVPKGTHRWNHFVKPSTLANWMGFSGLRFIDLKGFQYNPMFPLKPTIPVWSLSHSLDVNYIGCAVFHDEYTL